MFISEIQALYEKDIDRLKNEILAYENESDIWKTESSISNSAGTLCLHLCGNLNHFIAHLIGGTDYQRDREFEFSGQEVGKEELLKEIDELKVTVNNSLKQMQAELLTELFPVKLFDQEHSYQQILMFMHAHFSYHLGQINYHRRLVGSKG